MMAGWPSPSSASDARRGLGVVAVFGLQRPRRARGIHLVEPFYNRPAGSVSFMSNGFLWQQDRSRPPRAMRATATSW
jgi:hypothetical protein